MPAVLKLPHLITRRTFPSGVRARSVGLGARGVAEQRQPRLVIGARDRETPHHDQPQRTDHQNRERIAEREVAEHRVADLAGFRTRREGRSEEHTSELQSLMRISYAVFCLKKKK